MSDICSSSVYGLTVEEDAAAVIARQQHEIEQLKEQNARQKRIITCLEEKVERLKTVCQETAALGNNLLATDRNAASVINELGQKLLDRNIDFSNLKVVHLRLHRKMRECPVCNPGPPAV